MSGPARAAILAGGLGTRLQPYTAVLPKPLVPVGDRPILELILRWLAAGGVQRADVCIGHLGELIQTYFSQPGTIPDGIEVSWQREREPLGTAGALRTLADVDDTLMVVNGDILTDLDPAPMLALHRRAGAALTIATRRARVPTELGVIEHDGEAITGFQEKPVLEYTASMGIYLYEPRALALLPDGECQFPELVHALLARRERVVSFLSGAAWSHVGTLAQHYDASLRFRTADGFPGARDG
jgi:NDP-sugar pyrophosphorylase family protein